MTQTLITPEAGQDEVPPRLRVFGWQADEGGCAQYRIKWPWQALRRRGHQVGNAVTLPEQWQDAPIILGQRVCNPQPSAAWLGWIAEGRHCVLDLDDDLFMVDPTAPSARFFHQPSVRHALLMNIACASRVTVATRLIGERIRGYHTDIRVIPNGLPADVLSWRSPLDRPRRTGKVTVGWAGTPHTFGDLLMIGDVVKGLLAGPLADLVDVHLLGVDQEHLRQVGLAVPGVRVTPPVPPGYPYLKAIDFDVWLAPYRSTPFNDAKVPTKGLEAAFLGVPLVASGTEPYRQFVKHGHTGVVVDRPGEWLPTIEALVADVDLRRQFGTAARVQAADHTTEKTAPLWEQALAPSPDSAIQLEDQ